ncbi:PRC-barrel domain-containing protein [Methylobacterium aerolatum]|uniref:PRC-barrel domain-containing protein n=1 Tax=Methylobacterium aerolatum TaxID=418708 RepID=A0ABU0I0Y4_9HYPH|nr:PRC-barrel domain-containing protein [Methylobacterium aerolatum]MDQ0448251.1 hypothetical protein [Methylobacterium aerolatum]GJD35746.1 hypothetical protein FMGBMHLM_2658 [Methylobacterium aerolatum]
MRPRPCVVPFVLCILWGPPAWAQEATVIGQETILPGTGPGTATDGAGGGGLMQAGSETEAQRRQNLKPAILLASHAIGITVRNQAGESVGKIDDLLLEGGRIRAVVIDVSGFLGIGGKRIAVEPTALVLRPGGDRFSAILQMSKDAIAGAQPFDPAKAIPASK